jgi:hypothetical protein
MLWWFCGDGLIRTAQVWRVDGVGGGVGWIKVFPG